MNQRYPQSRHTPHGEVCKIVASRCSPASPCKFWMPSTYALERSIGGWVRRRERANDASLVLRAPKSRGPIANPLMGLDGVHQRWRYFIIVASAAPPQLPQVHMLPELSGQLCPPHLHTYGGKTHTAHTARVRHAWDARLEAGRVQRSG